MGLFYFITCCDYPVSDDNYFGIDFTPNETLIVGNTYKIIRESTEICGRYYDNTIPGGSPIYSDVIDVLNYGNNCGVCLEESPCVEPKPAPIPPQPIPVNECDVITIFPMNIECIVSNTTTPVSSDGEMSVSITGGTPPYTIIWSNGNVAPAIQNLTVGKYTATVVDYYGDFTATTTCELVSQYDCTFSGMVENVVVDVNSVYLITITGGTSEGPYTIYYDVIDDSNIALRYLYYTPATNVTLEDLIGGYSIIVPEETNVIYLYNQLCDTFQAFPVQPNQRLYDFCIVIDGDFAIHFNPSGNFNGYNTWISDDLTYQVIWDVNINKWVVSGGTIPYQIVSNSQYPPISGWYTIGGGNGNLISNEGVCNNVLPLGFNTRTQQPSCECDGSVVFLPSGGTPPYQYSIDNGVTFSTSSIFFNLCSGTYSFVIKDSNSNLFYKTQTLVNLNLNITYTVTLIPVVTSIINTPTLKTNQIATTLVVSPPLPSGVSLNINLTHSNVFSSSPTQTQSTLSNNTILTINGSPQGPPLNTIGNTTTNNTIPGCQNTTVYKTTKTEIWPNIIVNSSDVVVLNTTTSVSKTLSECLIGESLDSYTISKAIINGCSCCNVEIINSNFGSSGGIGGSSIGGILT